MHRFATAARAHSGRLAPFSPSAAALWVVALSLVVLPAAAQSSPAQGVQGRGITLEEAPCVPFNDNGLMRAVVPNPPGNTETRLYFRWDDHGDFYYVVMDAAADGTWWATPPKPTDENKQIEYYVAVVDPSESVVSRSQTAETPVTRDCPLVLDEIQRGYAENLVVGETTEDQQGKDVMGFLCDGIISRIGWKGVLRADSTCRRCIVAWWDKPEALVPAAVLLGGGITVTDIEASPSRP